jgi:hypothetical protein
MGSEEQQGTHRMKDELKLALLGIFVFPFVIAYLMIKEIFRRK